MEVYEMILNELVDTYEKLRLLPKPTSYRVGGEYYGSTQLFRTVGNMLDIIEGDSYIQYSYGTSTQYRHLFGIKIGGAYKDIESRELIENLRQKLIANRSEITGMGYTIVDDYGTNFNVIGIACI